MSNYQLIHDGQTTQTKDEQIEPKQQKPVLDFLTLIKGSTLATRAAPPLLLNESVSLDNTCPPAKHLPTICPEAPIITH